MRKIAIVNESYIGWAGVKQLLTREFPNYDIMIYHSDQYEEINQEKYQLDLVLLDIGVNMVESILKMTRRDIKIAAIISKVEQRLFDLFKLDLDGYLSTDIGIKELVAAIKKILKGKRYISPHLTEILLKEYIKSTSPIKSQSIIEAQRPEGLLTNREWEILEYIAKGYSNKKIGETLYISPRTVNNHILKMYKKIRVKDRTSAVVKAIKQGWISVHSI